MTPPLTQLKELAQMGMTQMASKKELEEILKAIIQVMRQLQENNDSNAKTLLARFQTINAELQKKGSDVEKLNGETQKMLGRVQNMIPIVPDLTPHEQRLMALESKKEMTMEEVMMKMPKDHKEEMEMMMKEMQEMKAKVVELEKRPVGRGGGGRKVPIIKRYNLTSQVNGTAKTFSLPRDTVDVVAVFGTQFPINFNPGTDWTFAGNTLTLTDAVSAPQTGQTLYAIIETLFYG